MVSVARCPPLVDALILSETANRGGKTTVTFTLHKLNEMFTKFSKDPSICARIRKRSLKIPEFRYFLEMYGWRVL